MKRLIVLILLILVGLMAGPASAVQSRDIAGSWVLDVEKTGSKEGPPGVIITLAGTDLTARLGGEKARLMTFKTDGTETDVSQGVRGKAVWKGNRLEATVIVPSGPETVTFSRDGAWLLVEASTEKGPMKFYFKRAGQNEVLR